MKNGIKVRLITDLSNYATGLVVGVEGITCDAKQWGIAGATGVRFTNGVQLDVFPRSLEIIDKDHLEYLSKQKQSLMEDLKTAKDIELTCGIRGGFKSLSFRSNKGFTSYSGSLFKNQALEILEIFEKERLYIKRLIE
jgi:hypothetical protein